MCTGQARIVILVWNPYMLLCEVMHILNYQQCTSCNRDGDDKITGEDA
jgi:hypothetical protein